VSQRSGWLIVLAVLVLGAADARAAAPLTIGSGHKPGLAVDPQGTAYLAWYGDEPTGASLHFCRLPRGASACEGQATIPADGGSHSRPFVTVAGPRVTIHQYRFGVPWPDFAQVWEFISTDAGATFDAGRPVGTVPLNEAVVGPGDAISAVSNADPEGLLFQNVPANGVATAAQRAELSLEHPYNASVALSGERPMVVSTDGSGQASAHLYEGSGSLNNEGNWTPPIDVGYADYPRLAGGLTGLFMLAGTASGGIDVRRWQGSALTFDAAVPLTSSGDDAQAHLTEDPSGRLHAVYPQLAADGAHLVHAVSDDGVHWASGTAFNQTDGGIVGLRVAAAGDRVGVAAWETTTASGAAEVRVLPVGPGAPAAQLPGKAARAKRLADGRVRLRISGRLGGLPDGLAQPTACPQRMVAKAKRGERKLTKVKLAVKGSCRFGARATIQRRRAGNARRLALTLRLRGNAVLAPSERTYRVKVKR
jgi:hypothetical protein